MGIVLELEIKEIHIPWELLPRVITGVVEDKVKEYAEMIESGVEFDPILVWDRGNEYWVIDGVHRIEAHKRAGRSTIKAELISCKDEIDCQIKAIQANLKHGLSIKKEEKISLVQKFYYHCGIGVEELSKIFGVSETTIYRWIGSVMKQKKEELKEQALKLRAQGFIQEAIAKMLGVDQATISRWERESLEEEIEKKQKDDHEKNMDYAFFSNEKNAYFENGSQNAEEDLIDIEETEVAFEAEENEVVQEVKQEKKEEKIEDWPFPVHPKTLLPEWIDRFRNDKNFRVRYMIEQDMFAYMSGFPIKYKDWIVEHEKEDYSALWEKCWLNYYKHRYKDPAKFPPIPPVPKSEKELAREKENQINAWVESEEFKSLIEEIFSKIVEIARYKGNDFAQRVIDELERRWEEWLYQNWGLVKKR